MHNCFLQVCLGKFHSVWLSDGGEAWCCGQQARAGGPHVTALRPAPLKLNEPCVAVAITLNSTVFLLESGMVCTVYSYDRVAQRVAQRRRGDVVLRAAGVCGRPACYRAQLHCFPTGEWDGTGFFLGDLFFPFLILAAQFI